MITMDIFRLFIAAKITNKTVKENLVAFQSKFKLKGIKLSKESQFHFTLHFLGDIPLSQVPALKIALDIIKEPKFEITLQGCNKFPRNNSPRIIWAGVTLGQEYLSRIRQSLVSPLKALGISIEKRDYKPHLTLARIKSLNKASNLLIQNLLKDFSEVNFGTSMVHEISLIKSELTPQGSKYTDIYNKKLSS